MKKTVYLDNAATTPMDPEVIAAMVDVLENNFGNASASHGVGRQAKALLEQCRKDIAAQIGAQAKEIIFTSGGTEADNMALRCAVQDLGITTIITSKIEHKAVLDTAKQLASTHNTKVLWVHVDDCGRVDYDHLEELLASNENVLVSLMHANNELGTLLDLKKVAETTSRYKALFHSDTVQTLGHLPIDVREIPVDFLTCSAHKLHGPKGVGFLYARENVNIKSMITGGGQERKHRPGTENIAGIKGLQVAFTKAYKRLEEDKNHILDLKEYMKKRLESAPFTKDVNGCCEADDSLYTVLNIHLPDADEMLLFQLDLAGVCCSGGSACNSGAAAGSHVLDAIGRNDGASIRFSFGRFTTKEDVDFAVQQLEELVLTQPA
jgi:cysteine desulfurase